jgi:hypothetical protein
MSAVPPASPRPAALPWWLAPSAIVVLAAGAVAVIWAYRDRPEGAPANPGPAAAPHRKFLPPPPPGDPGALHSVTTGVENGVRVWKIRVTPGGDELIVDAATGRLLETRPAKAAAAPGRPMIIAR